MKTSEVLKHAKRYLAKYNSECYGYNTERFICIAISTAASHTKRITDKDVERCCQMIESRLEGQHVLEQWLQHKGCIALTWPPTDPTVRDRIQQHRHAWLDMMITEFKSKGD